MKSTGEVMAIERSFEAAFSKALRSLEQRPPAGRRDPRPGAARQPQRPPHLRGHGGAARGGVGGGGQPPQHDLGVVRGPASGPGRGRGAVAARPRRRHPDHRQADGALRPADRRAGRRLPGRGGRCAPRGSPSRPPSSASTPARPSSPPPRPTTTPRSSPRTSDRHRTATPWWWWAAGPIRIGQGIEFDYCSVQAAEALRLQGVAAIMVNSNPETVSTDFDCSTRLYFEPLDQEAVLARHRGRAGERGRGPVRGPDRHQPRRAARPARGAHPRHHRRRHRPGRGPAPLRGADAPSRDPPAARGGHDRPRRGGRDRRPHRLPGARPPVVRAGREGDGGGPQSRSAPALRRRRDGRPPRGRRSGGRVPRHGAGRQVPLRHRGRRRRGVGRRDGGDPRADGACRAGRGPQRRTRWPPTPPPAWMPR